MKKLKLIFIVFLALLCLFKLAFYLKDNTLQSSKVPNSEYQYYLDDIDKITKEELLSIDSINKDKFIIYLGSAECPYCVEYIDEILYVLKNHRTDKYDILHYPVNMSKDYEDESFLNFMKAYSLETIPSFIVKENNKVSVISTEDIINIKKQGGD